MMTYSSLDFCGTGWCENLGTVVPNTNNMSHEPQKATQTTKCIRTTKSYTNHKMFHQQ